MMNCENNSKNNGDKNINNNNKNKINNNKNIRIIRIIIPQQ